MCALVRPPPSVPRPDLPLRAFHKPSSFTGPRRTHRKQKRIDSIHLHCDVTSLTRLKKKQQREKRRKNLDTLLACFPPHCPEAGFCSAQWSEFPAHLGRCFESKNYCGHYRRNRERQNNMHYRGELPGIWPGQARSMRHDSPAPCSRFDRRESDRRFALWVSTYSLKAAFILIMTVYFAEEIWFGKRRSDGRSNLESLYTESNQCESISGCFFYFRLSQSHWRE